MTIDELNYWGINKLKHKIHKMPNMILVLEWRNIRIHNDSCPYFDYSKCNYCVNREECYNSLAIEEVITEELIDRGLFDFAINVGSKILANTKSFDEIENGLEIDSDVLN